MRSRRKEPKGSEPSVCRLCPSRRYSEHKARFPRPGPFLAISRHSRGFWQRPLSAIQRPEPTAPLRRGSVLQALAR
jgi:hypothetical protein